MKIMCVICEQNIETDDFLNTAIGDVCKKCIFRYWSVDKYYQRTPFIRKVIDECRKNEEKEKEKCVKEN